MLTHTNYSVHIREGHRAYRCISGNDHLCIKKVEGRERRREVVKYGRIKRKQKRRGNQGIHVRKEDRGRRETDRS